MIFTILFPFLYRIDGWITDSLIAGKEQEFKILNGKHGDL